MMVGPSQTRRATQQINVAHPSDRQLLSVAARGDSGAFGEFYARHVRSLLGFFVQRTGAADVAADLAHETWVAALAGLSSYRGDGAPAAWLYGIARRKLALSRRHGRVEASARGRLLREPLELTSADLEEISGFAELLPVDTPALDLLERLPEPQREAIRARMLDELDYPAIASGLRCSEAVVRQRVSRGLRALRADSERRGLGA
jgi:RNA polymerase sigma factor (sigma-70 family)